MAALSSGSGSIRTKRRLMKGADQVLARRRIDPGLAADRGIDLGKKRCRDLDETTPAPKTRGDIACEIADDSAAESDK